MAKKRSPKEKKPIKPWPDPGMPPAREKAPPEDSKVRPLDPPPPPEEGGTPGYDDFKDN